MSRKERLLDYNYKSVNKKNLRFSMNIDAFQNFFSNSTFSCLFLSLIFYWTSLIFKDLPLIYISAKLTAIFGNLFLFLILATRWLVHGYFPLSNLYESLLFLAWVLLFVQILLENKTRSTLIGPLVMPIVLLIDGFASLTLPIEMQKASPLVPALQSNWLMMHVSLMMLSYGTLIVGSLLSILYIVVFYKENVKISTITDSNESGLLISESLPSNPRSLTILQLLQNIDNLSYRTISLGFPFLTVGIIAGAVWANEAWGSYWSWDPKETWALITWLVFAAYLHARIIKGWRGERPALLGSIGFFVVWICYLGVNFLGQGLHSYGWLGS